MPDMQTILAIDSHTEGEPTRVIYEPISLDGWLAGGSMSDRLKVFRDRFDDLRSSVINEPRGSEALVGAMLCKPVDPSACAGVIYFNNVGYLGMCGHGTIGLIAT